MLERVTKKYHLERALKSSQFIAIEIDSICFYRYKHTFYYLLVIMKRVDGIGIFVKLKHLLLFLSKYNL